MRIPANCSGITGRTRQNRTEAGFSQPIVDLINRFCSSTTGAKLQSLPRIDKLVSAQFSLHRWSPMASFTLEALMVSCTRSSDGPKCKRLLVLSLSLIAPTNSNTQSRQQRTVLGYKSGKLRMRRFKAFHGFFQLVQKSLSLFRLFFGANCFMGRSL